MLFNLLDAKTRIETPFIKVTFGDYTFGVFQKTDVKANSQGVYSSIKTVYPNYVQRMTVDKINGQVNQYNLQITYAIRPGDDPNYFEKVFSSISKTRKVIFSYGDASLPDYIYKNEEALITGIDPSFDFRNGAINYSIKAVSASAIAYSGNYSFPGGYFKPSDKIKQLLCNNSYGLKKLFYGMIDDAKVQDLGLIASNDKVVKIGNKTNISPLEYIKYLVSCMIPESVNMNDTKNMGFYNFVICDEVIGDNTINILTEELGGPYFKIVQVNKHNEHADAYEIEIGYPSNNIVTNFGITDNQNYSIYFDWQSELNDNQSVLRINDSGELEERFSQVVSSNNNPHLTRADDITWWTKVTEYPISATITLKGLIRPAILMEYIHLKVNFYGHKHISSGLYIITKQSDSISEAGYRTTLTLTRVQGEGEHDYDY